MALSNSQIRAIAIRRSIAKRSASTAQIVTAERVAPGAPTAANDNERSTRTPGSHRRMSTGMLSACLAASGFDLHAAR